MCKRECALEIDVRNSPKMKGEASLCSGAIDRTGSSPTAMMGTRLPSIDRIGSTIISRALIWFRHSKYDSATGTARLFHSERPP